MAILHKNSDRTQLVFMVTALTVLTHFIGLIQPSLAATGASSSSTNSEAASSTQPLWSYQVKPTNYVGAQSAPSGHYASAPPSSLFDAFTSLSQRQGALTSSPFMSILPIILIAAGGLLLLLPMLTMMMASPFGGGGGPFGGGYGNGFGYPQVGALNRRRSLDQPQHQRGLVELIEHVSGTIEELSRRYAAPASANGGNNQASAQQQVHKRAKALNAADRSASTPSSSTTATNEASQVQPPSNHKPSGEVSMLDNIVSGSL